MQNRLLILTLLLFLSLFANANSLASNSNTIENAIVKQVNQALPAAIKTLEKAVNINSGTMNFAGVKKVGQLFQAQLQELGLTTQWIDGRSFGRAGHLLATHLSGNSDNQGIKILMIGHLDTVFAKTDKFQTFQAQDKRYIKGPGITDMKGGDIIIIETIRALKSLDLLNKVSIKIVMTGDEEKSGHPLSLSKQAIVDAAKWADIALGFEDGDGNIKTAVTARRGSVGWTLKITGKPAHSSQIFREDIGYGAIYEMARILNQFRLQITKEELLTVNPGLAIGGTRISYNPSNSEADGFGKSNVIAKTAKVTGDIRAISSVQLKRAKKIMQNIVSDNLTQTSAEIIFDEGYPPMAPTQGNAKLLSLYSQVSEDLGYGSITAVNPRKAGAADISFASDYVAMSLDGLGLMGTGGHTKNEIADLDSLVKNIQKAALLIYRLSQQEK